MNVFTIKDQFGKRIHLTGERMKHILSEHPDIVLEEIFEAITKPLIVRQDNKDKRLNYYYKFNKINKKYLMVIVKYLNDHGFIITSFHIKKIKNEKKY